MEEQKIIVEGTVDTEEKVETKKGKKGLIALAGAALAFGAYKLIKHLTKSTDVEPEEESDPFEGVDEPIDGIDIETEAE